MAAATKQKSISERMDLDLRAAMRSRMVEREDEIEIFILALVAKQHAFFYGKKGIAKSYGVETGLSYIGGLDPNIDYFHLLFSKYTTHEHVFGPLMLSLLKEDRLVHKGEGFLPCCKVGFGDEYWKANSAMQNDLLWATNERLWRNDGMVLPIPLWSMFIASNEIPEDDELEAAYDRFLLRRETVDIVEPGSFIDMLKLPPPPKDPDPIVMWPEIEQAHDEAMKVFIPGDVYEAYAKVRKDLQELGINCSSRRFKQGLDIVRAKAWLEGQSEADIEHLRALVNVLWEEPNQYNDVFKLLEELANPIDKDIIGVERDLGKLSSEVHGTIQDDSDLDLRQRSGLQEFDRVEKAMQQLIDIDSRLKGSKKRSQKLAKAKDDVKSIAVRILTEIFMMPLDEVETSPLMQGFRKLEEQMASDGTDGEE